MGNKTGLFFLVGDEGVNIPASVIKGWYQVNNQGCADGTWKVYKDAGLSVPESDTRIELSSSGLAIRKGKPAAKTTIYLAVGNPGYQQVRPIAFMQCGLEKISYFGPLTSTVSLTLNS